MEGVKGGGVEVGGVEVGGLVTETVILVSLTSK